MTNISVAIDKLIALSGKKENESSVYTESFFDEYEKSFGIQIQPDHRELLKRASNVFWGTIELLDMTEHGDSRCELSNAVAEARSQGVPHDWLPICEDNGDYYCLLPDGTVHYWSHDGQTDEIWNSLSVWVEEVWIEGN